MNLRCQEMTQKGIRCTRRAKIKIDTKKGKKIYGKEIIPKTNCCFFCAQHFAIYLGIGVLKLSVALAVKDLSYDEYIVIDPQYLEDSLNKIK
jgi:hypothetical protein